MRVTENEQVIFCDVDETLIMHDKHNYPDLPQIAVRDPYSQTVWTVAVHVPHVQLLKERFKRGAKIKVMSHGGYAWAAAVVDALGLVPIIDECMSKPIAIIDDLPIHEALGHTMYMNPNSKWKRDNGEG